MHIKFWSFLFPAALANISYLWHNAPQHFPAPKRGNVPNLLAFLKVLNARCYAYLVYYGTVPRKLPRQLPNWWQDKGHFGNLGGMELYLLSSIFVKPLVSFLAACSKNVTLNMHSYLKSRAAKKRTLLIFFTSIGPKCGLLKPVDHLIPKILHIFWEFSGKFKKHVFVHN